MRTLIALSAIVLFCSTLYAQQLGTGLMWEDEEYSETALSAPLTRSVYTVLPPSYSLKEYTPTPGNQGNSATCAGWAAAYAIRTIMEADHRELDDKSEIDANSFSPYFVYNQIKNPSDNQCTNGAHLTDALDLLKEKGVVPTAVYPNECNFQVDDAAIESAANYKIDDYKRLFWVDAENKELPVKKALTNDKPVLIGMSCPPSFMNTGGLWTPDSGEYGIRYPGHAVAVIGYDDEMHGGAFEIMNSWGTSWGDDGYAWIKYDDFNHFVMYAYEIIIMPKEEPTAEEEVYANDLAGMVRFIHINGDTMSLTYDSPGLFVMDKPYPSGTRFQTEIYNESEAYVYAIGTDLTGKHYALYPRESNLSAHISANSSFLLPGPTKNFFTRLDNTVGTDYYIMLFSKAKLDFGALIDSLDVVDKPAMSRLRTVLAEKLAATENIEYSDALGVFFSAATMGKDIVPVVVEIEHVDKAPEPAEDTTPPQIALIDPKPAAFRAPVNDNEEIVFASSDTLMVMGNAQDESSIKEVTINGKPVVATSSGRFQGEAVLGYSGENIVVIKATDEKGNEAELSLIVFRKK